MREKLITVKGVTYRMIGTLVFRRGLTSTGQPFGWILIDADQARNIKAAHKAAKQNQ